MTDRDFLGAAISLAAEALDDNDGGPFGAVVVRAGEIVGRGRNRVLATADPTAHAEMLAIRDASLALGNHVLDDCVIYTSSEPCPMCLAAIYWARIPRVVYANLRADAAAIGFDDDHIYQELATLLEERSIAMEHHPVPEASRVLIDWSAKPDSTLY